MQEHLSLQYKPNGLVLVLGSMVVVVVAGYLWMILLFWDVSDRRGGELLELLSYFFAPYLSTISLFDLSRVWRFRRAIFKVNQDGVHDIRLTKTLIPWEDIQQLALQPRLFSSKIVLTLKHGRSVKDYGSPGNIPHLLRGRKSSALRFGVGMGLEKNAASIANDINSYAGTPPNLKVGRA